MGTGELRNSRLVKPVSGIKLPSASVLAQDTKRCNITADEIWESPSLRFCLVRFLQNGCTCQRLFRQPSSERGWCPRQGAPRKGFQGLACRSVRASLLAGCSLPPPLLHHSNSIGGDCAVDLVRMTGLAV